jgi:hypothetical protein
MMTKMITINRCGDSSQISTKSTDAGSFHKRVGFKTDRGFALRHSFAVPKNLSDVVRMVTIFAKNEGRAGSENKTELPPPIDSELFYGNILVVGYGSDGVVRDITVVVWEKIYEYLFGGFENLDDTAETDENEIDELDAYPDEMKTKHGYLKDGFVVDSDEEEESIDLSFDEYV